MKNIVIAVLLVTTLVLGALVFKEQHKRSEAEATIVTLHETVTEVETRLAQQEKQTLKLQNNLLESRTEGAVKATTVAQLEVALTNQTQAASQAAGSNTSSVAELFKSKDMRDVIRTQQKILG